MSLNTKDAAAGALFILLGLGFGLNAYLGLELGTALRMGPGYFPLVLSGILFVLGLAIVLRSINSVQSDWGHFAWRGLFLITLAPVLFGATLRGLGLVPALTIVAFIASFASQRVGVLLALALTAGLVLFCVAVFSWGLGLPIQLFGPWMRVVGLGN
jgi:hypothetical protein